MQPAGSPVEGPSPFGRQGQIPSPHNLPAAPSALAKLVFHMPGAGRKVNELLEYIQEEKSCKFLVGLQSLQCKDGAFEEVQAKMVAQIVAPKGPAEQPSQIPFKELIDNCFGNRLLAINAIQNKEPGAHAFYLRRVDGGKPSDKEICIAIVTPPNPANPKPLQLPEIKEQVIDAKQARQVYAARLEPDNKFCSPLANKPAAESPPRMPPIAPQQAAPPVAGPKAQASAPTDAVRLRLTAFQLQNVSLHDAVTALQSLDTKDFAFCLSKLSPERGSEILNYVIGTGNMVLADKIVREQGKDLFISRTQASPGSLSIQVDSYDAGRFDVHYSDKPENAFTCFMPKKDFYEIWAKAQGDIDKLKKLCYNWRPKPG